MLRFIKGWVLCLGILFVFAMPSSVFAAETTKVVLVGKTAAQKKVVLSISKNTNYPLPGVCWDSFMLRVGDRGYVFSKTKDKPERWPQLRLKIENWMWRFGYIFVEFEGRMQEVDLSRRGTPRVRSDSRYPTRQVKLRMFARNLKRRGLVKLLTPNLSPTGYFSWPLKSTHMELTIGNREIRLPKYSLSGHLERDHPFRVFNRSKRQAGYIVYDYEAAHRYGKPKRGIVRYRRRTIFNRFNRRGVALGSWKNARGRGYISPRRTRTDFISEIRIGNLIVERRIVRFNVGVERSWFLSRVLGWKSRQGVKEVYRRAR